MDKTLTNSNLTHCVVPQLLQSPVKSQHPYPAPQGGSQHHLQHLAHRPPLHYQAEAHRVATHVMSLLEQVFWDHYNYLGYLEPITRFPGT